jgi:hypothetical protein
VAPEDHKNHSTIMDTTLIRLANAHPLGWLAEDLREEQDRSVSTDAPTDINGGSSQCHPHRARTPGSPLASPFS